VCHTICYPRTSSYYEVLSIINTLIAVLCQCCRWSWCRLCFTALLQEMLSLFLLRPSQFAMLFACCLLHFFNSQASQRHLKFSDVRAIWLDVVDVNDLLMSSRLMRPLPFIDDQLILCSQNGWLLGLTWENLPVLC